MDVLDGVGQLDYANMAVNDVVLVLQADDTVVRLWRRRQGLQVSPPVGIEELNLAELLAVEQHKLGLGVPQ